VLDLLDVQTQTLRYATAIIGIGFEKQRGLPQLNASLSLTEVVNDIAYEVIAVHVGHGLPVQVAGLYEIIIGITKWEVSGIAGNLERRLTGNRIGTGPFPVITVIITAKLKFQYLTC